MSYEKLSKLFYKDPSRYEAEVDKRRHSYGIYQTELMINGFRKGKRTSDVFSLFYVHTHALMKLNQTVLKNSGEIKAYINQLPPFIISLYFQKLIINEAQSNNEIENVKSTKRELREALDDNDPLKKKRFNGLMKTYATIDQLKPFTTLADFRKLYDDLVSDEIRQEDELDGHMFRNDYVEINDGVKTTHIGLSTEEDIQQALLKLIAFLSDDNHPQLYRYMLGHYYYEYIHPFYDGNGRTGRLILGAYLAKELDKYSAITLSYAINKNKQKYYKALEEMPSPLNQGEATFYLIDMLELLIEGQQTLMEDFEINIAKMTRIDRVLHENDTYTNDEKAVLTFMSDATVFVDETMAFSVQMLMEAQKKSRYMINKTMDKLEQLGDVRCVNQKPKQYQLTETFLDKLFI